VGRFDLEITIKDTGILIENDYFCLKKQISDLDEIRDLPEGLEVWFSGDIHAFNKRPENEQ
jgi:hypothetical protein